MKRALVPLAVVLVLSTSVCIADAQQQARVFAESVIAVEPGHMAEYLNLIEQDIMPFLAEQGVEVIGVFQSGIGTPSNEVRVWLAYRDLAHVQAVAQSSTLTAIQQQTFESMRVLETFTLTPASFSPMR